MIRFLFGDKEFYKTLIRIGSPIALQFLITSSLNLVDNILVGQLGTKEVAAVGLANQVFFILSVVLFGVSSGASIFTAQFWGKRDLKNIHRVVGLSLIISLSISFVFSLAGILFPRQVLSIFTEDSEVIGLGSQFLRIISISYMFTAVSFSYVGALRSTEHVRLPMVSSIMALSVNTVLNYILIFGMFGVPAMGVAGSATATTIARVLEMVMILSVMYKGQYAPAAKISEMLDISKDFIGRFIHTTIPVILNESFWSLGITMYSIVYGRMGTGIVASVNIAATVERLALVLFMGMSHACAVMVGKQIGAEEESTALAYAKRFEVLGPLLTVVTGTALILSSGLILSAYQVSADVREGARILMILMACTMPVRVFNMINIVGILRSGGDTKFCLLIETAGLWLVAVPLAFLGGLVWKLPFVWVYILVFSEELFKFILGLRRLLSGKWINNLVKHVAC